MNGLVPSLGELASPLFLRAAQLLKGNFPILFVILKKTHKTLLLHAQVYMHCSLHIATFHFSHQREI